MKTITRYIAVTSRDDSDIAKGNVWCIDAIKPETPYLKIKVKVIKNEKRHKYERKKDKRNFPLRIIQKIIKTLIKLGESIEKIY